MEMICSKIFLLVASQVILFASPASTDEKIGDTQVAYEWIKLDFMWPNETIKNNYITTGKYIPENCILSGLEVFEHQIYVTVPRLRLGVPSSLNVLKMQNNKTVLKPYPSLEKNVEGMDKCDNLQFVSNIKIDRRNGWMWIIDTGRVNLLPFDGTNPLDLCPAKIVIYNTRANSQVRSHFFSEKVVSKISNYLADIAIDGKMAYIADTFDNRLIVYNYDTDTSYSLEDVTMMPDQAFVSFTVGEDVINWRRGINGIALSSDFKTLYYSPFSSFSLYSVPTSVLKNNITAFKNSVKYVGDLTSVTDAMLFDENRLYVSLLSKDAIFYWDMRKPVNGVKNDTVNTFKMLVKDSKSMQWPDSLAIDGHYLWFTTNRMQKFFRMMDFTGNDGANFRILKTYIGGKGEAGKNAFSLTVLFAAFCATVFAHFH